MLLYQILKAKKWNQTTELLWKVLAENWQLDHIEDFCSPSTEFYSKMFITAIEAEDFDHVDWGNNRMMLNDRAYAIKKRNEYPGSHGGCRFRSPSDKDEPV